MLIDVHAHLSDGRFAEDEGELAALTETQEPRIIVDTGASRATSENCFERAKRYRGIYCAVGVHPEDADKLTDDDLNRFSEIWRSEKTVAIGEIGLDYHYESNPPREVQRRAMLEQLKLASELGAPSVIHIRDAHGDAFKILKENASLLKNGFLVHCYSGSKEMVAEYARLGAYFSYGGVITFAGAKDKPETVRATPRDRILLETDCPYMTPVPMRGRKNLPAYIVYTAQKMAEIIGSTLKETEAMTTDNALRLFGKIKL